MKVLWFSNCRLSEANPTSTGSWLYSMAQALRNNGVDLYNVTTGNDIVLKEYSLDKLQEWVLPQSRVSKDYLPPREIIVMIQEVINKVNPDIIHIWGMEGYWSRLSLKGYIKGPVLLEMQGLLSSCAEYFYGGLTRKERWQCYGLKECILYTRSLPYQRKILAKRGRQEKEILRQHVYVVTQSDWVRARIYPFLSKDCHVFNTDIAVRQCFLESIPWKNPERNRKVILSIASGDTPYKGLHVALKALQIVKMKYNNVELRIVGDYAQNAPIWRKSGYVKFLERQIQQLGLSDNVVFLGTLDAKHIVSELLSANIFLQSSFVESYSLTVAEALSLGVPSVISYAGAMPELAKDGLSALYYNSTDYYKCAFQINLILDDDQQAELLSQNAISNARKRHSGQRVVDIQMNIYKEYLKLINSDAKHR